MMSVSDTPTRGPARPGPYFVAGLILLIATVLPLVVPLYARSSPELAGIPFFYWYQMLLVPMTSFLIWIAYLVVGREDRRRRAAVRSEPTETGVEE
jgi:cytochrome c biogenesis factor